MFGVIGFASAVVLYFTHLAACGVDLPGIRDVAGDPSWIERHAPGILTARLLFSLALALVLGAGALLFLEPPESVVLALYGLTLIAVGPNPRFLHLGLSQPRPVAIARTLGEATFVLGVLLFVREPSDIGMVPWSQFLGDLLATALMVWWLAARGFRLPLRLDWALVAPVFRRSFPLVVNILLGLAIYNSDLIFLWLFRDSRTVGFYSASYQLISFLINMSWAYSYSLLPILARSAADRDARNALYMNSVAQSFAVSLPIAVGGALVAPQLVALVFGPEYEPAALPLAILLASVPFMLFKDVGMVALIVSGREKTVMRTTAVAVAVNLGLNVLVIPRYGMAGAACTTLATEVLRAMLVGGCVLAERYPQVDFKRLLKSSAAALAMGLVLFFFPPGSLWLGLALGAAVYAAALFASGGIVLRRDTWPSLNV